MFAELLGRLREMTYAERAEAICKVIDQSWPDDQYGRLALIYAHALRNLGRTSEALSVVAAAVQRPIGDAMISRLLEIRALIQIDTADDAAALDTVAEMERHGIADVQLPEVFGIRAKALSLQGSDESFAWFRQARDGFVAAENQRDADLMAVRAALQLIDTGRSPQEWLAMLPVNHLYRLAIESELALSSGNVAEMHRLADTVLSAPDADPHVQARAFFVQAMAEQRSNLDLAALLIEKSLTLSTSQLAGYEPRLVERIRRFRRLCEEGKACVDS